jgi:hypothetical protein
MPPPLLPRHLRPCRSPWSAHHVRCASSTARAKLSNVSDDRPESSSPSGSAEGKQAGNTHRSIDRIDMRLLIRWLSRTHSQTRYRWKRRDTPLEKQLVEARIEDRLLFWNPGSSYRTDYATSSSRTSSEATRPRSNRGPHRWASRFTAEPTASGQAWCASRRSDQAAWSSSSGAGRH